MRKLDTTTNIDSEETEYSIPQANYQPEEECDTSTPPESKSRTLVATHRSKSLNVVYESSREAIRDRLRKLNRL